VATAEKAGDFVAGDDGYFIWWPSGMNGGLSAELLRLLADELDRRNAEHDAALVAYFESPPPEGKE
jgi:hypothetical protein